MMFRNRRLVRAAACFLLLETVGNIVAPAVSWAAMGPAQPEFTSYESPGSTDMVNLTTGDMTYNIPIMDVPGPERSFSLPLTYRAGIRLEQEASWVGLGWSLNPGAIARSLNNYPDDAATQQYTSTFKQDVNRGWYGGVPGVLDLAWDQETGHSGTADLIGLASVGWANGKMNSFDLVGVKYTKGQGLSVDPVRMAFAAVTIASLGSTAAAAGSLEAGVRTASVGQKLAAIGGSVGVSLGEGAAFGTAMSMIGRAGGSGGGGFMQPIVKEEKKFLHTNYWIFYNDVKYETMYGSLWFKDMTKNLAPRISTPGYARGPKLYDTYVPSFANGPQADVFKSYSVNNDNTNSTWEVGADLHQFVGPGEADYLKTGNRPISIAHDDFSVMGDGVSGSIRPQRLDVGSLAFPKKMSETHDKYALTPYVSDYKVPFRYENSAANGYDYPRYDAPIGESVTGIAHDTAGLGSLILRDDRLKNLFNPGGAAATAPARKGIINQLNATSGVRERGFVQGKHVDWYSNEEIDKDIYKNSVKGDGERFLEFYQPTQKTLYQTVMVSGPGGGKSGSTYGTAPAGATNNPFRYTAPGKGIGAFRVTAEDGTTYHYSLPVYHYTTYSESKEKTLDNPATSGSRIGDNNSGFIYATTWLLTAITSSDYVDRGKPGTGAGLGMVDDQDWGGWVRFDYGRFSPNYKWRQPYVGDSYGEKDMKSGSFSEGVKETYYLNSIRTRSHTAYFVKSVRQDGRGHFQPGVASTTSNVGFDENAPSSSLRLDEIVLLTNEDADKLSTADGIRPVGSAGTPVPALGPNTAQYPTGAGTTLIRNGDSYAAVLDGADIAQDSRIRDYINQRALKRVIFNYSYRLCLGTASSFADLSQQLPSMDPAKANLGRSGKLTLESISTFGPLNTKLIADFKFTYANNPNYGRDKWDGFGMYNSNGVADYTGHAVTNNHQAASTDGAAWSLTEILNPLGSRTQISYERDQYRAVSEYGAKKLDFSNSNSLNTLTVNNFTGDLTSYLRPGDTITVSGTVGYSGFCGPSTRRYAEDFSTALTYKRVPISSVSATTITVKQADWPSATLPPVGISCGQVTATGATVKVLVPENTEGGDIRVAAISTLDENGNRYQVRYRYLEPSQLPISNSSGVISKLPEFVSREENLPMYAWYDYPGTSVMYGRATVLRGRFQNNADTDIDQREEFTFYTPVSRMVKVTPDGGPFESGTLGREWVGSTYFRRNLEKRDNRITVNTGKIGQSITILKYNRRGELELSSRLTYTNTMPNPEGIPGQGRFTEGALTSELLDQKLYRINRTTKEYVPTTLAATTTMTNGMQVVSQSTLYDFLTGQVLETTAKNSLGDTYVTKTVPAYILAPNAGMGPKGENAANRNMLSQVAGRYVYKQADGGSRRLVAASVQTWNQNWNTYRGYSNGEYVDEGATKGIWRQQESYVWNGAGLNADGTFASFTDFNWSQPTAAGQAPGWLKAGEVLRYDHYSKPLEVVDLNGQYAASKTGYGNAKSLASAANSRYTEFAYSGAEDQARPDAANAGTVHYGGEVRDGGQRDATYHHAGAFASNIPAGQLGFTYRAPVGGATGIRAGRQYRLSAWIYRSDVGVNGGKLYAQLNGNALTTPVPINTVTTKKAGDWYLLNLYVSLPIGSTGVLTVGCRNDGPNPVYMDDFRFQPLLGPLTAYNYDPQTGMTTYVLNNDNLYTRYQYDAAGKVSQVYKETLDRPNDASASEKLVLENGYNYARMREPNWVRTGMAECEPKPDGSPTGYRRYRRQDVNPRSITYNQVDWERGEYSVDCPTCTGAHQRWINGRCDTGVKGSCVSSRLITNGIYENTYRYTYSDGSVNPETVTESFACQP